MAPPSGCHFKIKWQPDDTPIRLSFKKNSFYLEMTTGWHTHLVVILKKFILFGNDNRMAYSSGCHFDFEMTTGWGCHPVFIFKSKWEPDRTRPVLIHQIGKLFCSSSTTPKPQINYSNQQYHLLIANKHQKLLTYCLF